MLPPLHRALAGNFDDEYHAKPTRCPPAHEYDCGGRTKRKDTLLEQTRPASCIRAACHLEGSSCCSTIDRGGFALFQGICRLLRSAVIIAPTMGVAIWLLVTAAAVPHNFVAVLLRSGSGWAGGRARRKAHPVHACRNSDYILRSHDTYRQYHERYLVCTA